jgi:hypothetical protein
VVSSHLSVKIAQSVRKTAKCAKKCIRWNFFSACSSSAAPDYQYIGSAEQIGDKCESVRKLGGNFAQSVRKFRKCAMKITRWNFFLGTSSSAAPGFFAFF